VGVGDAEIRIVGGEQNRDNIPSVNTSQDSILAWSMRDFKPRGPVVVMKDERFPSFQEDKVLISCPQLRH
jgi:hypothetical protein